MQVANVPQCQLPILVTPAWLSRVAGGDVRNGAGEQQRHGPGMCAQCAGERPRLPEPFDKPPDLESGDGVRNSEPAGDETCGGIRPGA
jgi:hypothetical protein